MSFHFRNSDLVSSSRIIYLFGPKLRSPTHVLTIRSDEVVSRRWVPSFEKVGTEEVRGTVGSRGDVDQSLIQDS